MAALQVLGCIRSRHRQLETGHAPRWGMLKNSQDCHNLDCCYEKIKNGVTVLQNKEKYSL